MASALPAFVNEARQPAKLLQPQSRAAAEAEGLRWSPAVGSPPVQVRLPARGLGWSFDDLPQDSQSLQAAEVGEPATTGGSTPCARSRSGSNLQSPPGLVAPPGTPSHGSTLHGTGICRPCAWFWKPSGCQNGQECGHCHLCPEGEIKNRKKNKLTMMRLGLATPNTSHCSPLPDVALPLDFGYPHPSVPLGFGFPPEPSYATSCSPWSFPDIGAFASISEPETTTASGSDRGSLATASPATERDSGAADSSASETGDQEAAPGPPPGLKAPPNTPSHGSVLHNLGTCQPCAWFHKPSGCQNGRECNYCHICSDGELKSRKKNKQVAMRLGLVTPKKDLAEQDARYALSLASCI